MKNIQFFYNYTTTFFRRKLKFILLGMAIIILAVVVFLSSKEALFKASISEGVIGTYTETDLPELVTDLMSQPLVKIDPAGKPQPNLITGWQVSDDGKLYTVKLKNNLFWLDGSKLRADDINLAIPDVEIKKIDDLTIQFKLADSFSPFPSLLNKPIFKKGSLIGLGPYQISEIKKDQVFVKKIVLKPANKNLADLVIKFYPSEKIAKNAFRLGQIQSLLGVTELIDLMKEKNVLVWSKTNFSRLVTIFYNTKDPILSDENFRLALSFGAPSIKGETEAKSSIAPTSWVFNEDVKDYLDNLAQEKHYLDKVKNGKDTTITLTATSFLKNVGERVVEAWQKAGIQAVLRVESGIPQNFQALLIAQNIPTDPDQYSLWHSTQAQTNISKLSSPRVDKDLEDGRKIQDPEIRKQKYKDFQKSLLDDSPATFLYFPKYNVVYMKKIEESLKKVLDLQLQYI